MERRERGRERKRRGDRGRREREKGREGEREIEKEKEREINEILWPKLISSYNNWKCVLFCANICKIVVHELLIPFTIYHAIPHIFLIHVSL